MRIGFLKIHLNFFQLLKKPLAESSSISQSVNGLNYFKVHHKVHYLVLFPLLLKSTMFLSVTEISICNFPQGITFYVCD